MTRLLPRAVGTAAVATLLAGVVAVAAEPTGSATPSGLIPATSRAAADVAVAHAHVLLVADDQGRLGVLVAYRGEKGWLAARPPAAPLGTQAAWTTTRGGGGVPALSMAFGTTTAAGVRVGWADGTTNTAHVAGDGTWLVVRGGQALVQRVDLIAANGSVTGTVGVP